LGDARARQEEQALRIETLRARNTAQALTHTSRS